MRKVTEVLRAELKAALSQAGVARATGIAESQLSRFRRGAGLEDKAIDALALHFNLELRPARKSGKSERR
jgi:hypothetical protein